MKIKLFILVVVIGILLLSFKASTPYSGKYYAGTTNEELVLNSNNNFNIYISSYKNSINITGTYNIFENHIKLITNNKDDVFYIYKVLIYFSTGKVKVKVLPLLTSLSQEIVPPCASTIPFAIDRPIPELKNSVS